MGAMSIGALARASGVSCRTIRYYEELGILPEPARSAGGTRRYPKEYLGYLEDIRRFKNLGFSLEQIRDLGILTPAGPTAQTVEVIDERIRELERQISDLRRFRAGAPA